MVKIVSPPDSPVIIVICHLFSLQKSSGVTPDGSDGMKIARFSAIVLERVRDRGVTFVNCMSSVEPYGHR